MKRLRKIVLFTVAVLLVMWAVYNFCLPGRVFGKFQLTMLSLSVNGAEWLLHCLNVRVWADGTVFRMGFRTFEVPELQSGMRTAVTVLLCTLGGGMLFRLKWYEIISFLLLGFVQALVLNILRIFFMVFWASRKPTEWAETFLHDTFGAFLVAAVLLVLVEMLCWKILRVRYKLRKEGMKRGDIVPRYEGSMLPRFWQIVSKWAWVGVTLFLIAGAGAAAIYKSRPVHHAAMISDVVAGLLQSDLEAAERAVNAGLALVSDDRNLLSKRAHVLVLRLKFKEALVEIEALPGSLTTFEVILKSWALIRLDRTDEAISLVEALPEVAKSVPVIAMVRAEQAILQNKPEEVSRNAIIAGRSLHLSDRVRALFPYLATHEQWQTIVDSDSNLAYKKITHALIAIHANLKKNNITDAANALKRGLETWPNHPMFLDGLSTLAVRRPGGEREELFADNFKANVSNLDADSLASYISYCFHLSRPDLVWLAYTRLRVIDPRDPALYIAPALYGGVWFTFRRHQLGVSAGSRYAKIDLMPFYLRTRNMKPFKSFWERVPLAEELAGENLVADRRKYLKLCLAELIRREKEGKLSWRMEMNYAMALAIAGQYAEAHARLDEINEKYPGNREEILFQHAVFYDQQGEWQKSYETLMEYYPIVDLPNMTASLMLVNALMNLNLGVYAMEVAKRAGEVFPFSPRIDMAAASIWDVFGFKEQALFVLSSGDAAELYRHAIVQLLYETGRFNEASTMSRGLGIRIRRSLVREKQWLVLAPAELSVAKVWPEPLSAEDMDREADKIEAWTKNAHSPFVRRLAQLAIDWYRAQGRGSVSDCVRWRAVGRNSMEQAAALHQLTLLLARQKKYGAATKAAEQAVEFMPGSAMLRRILIALTDGDRRVVEEARTACPDDPEIWLASLVVGTQRAGNSEIKRAVTNKTFSVETMVRAGDFLLRKRMIEPAAIAARDAVSRCRGLVPAYVLGLRCALVKDDFDWAILCALGGIANMREPWRFHRIIVDIKTLRASTDADMVASLEFLKEYFREDPQWGERLGDIYFQKGDMNRAMSVLVPVIDESIRDVRVLSLLFAAEAARLDSKPGEAVRILETAHAMYPDKISVLNNLVYNLAQNQATVARANQLLPKLLETGSKLFSVLDTAAVVCLRSGELKLAEKYMEEAAKLLDEDDYSVPEINLNAAEILFHQGKYEDAKRRLEMVRRDRHRSQLVDLRARELLEKLERAMRK